MTGYCEAIVACFCRYQKEVFQDHLEIFEHPDMGNGSPPVFLCHAAESNVIIAPDMSEAVLRIVVPLYEDRKFTENYNFRNFQESRFGSAPIRRGRINPGEPLGIFLGTTNRGVLPSAPRRGSKLSRKQPSP